MTPCIGRQSGEGAELAAGSAPSRRERPLRGGRSNAPQGSNMAELRVENIRISEQFNAALLQIGVVMPLEHRPNDMGEVIDAAGTIVLQVDPLGTMPDDQASAIAEMIILALDTCGSFNFVRRQETADGR
jgi:queuine/archaeosine tRNA-ribosyltransferase